MQHNVYIYIAVMALVTYLIRTLPLTPRRDMVELRLIVSLEHFSHHSEVPLVPVRIH